MAHPTPERSVTERDTVSGAGAHLFLAPHDGLHDTLDLIRDWSAAMAAHIFQVGQAVVLGPGLSRNVPGGIYVVIKQLPEGHRRVGVPGKECQRTARARGPRKRVKTIVVTQLGWLPQTRHRVPVWRPQCSGRGLC